MIYAQSRTFAIVMINLYPGPSQLFHSVRDHIRQALKLKLPELPAESNEAAELIQQTSQRFRELLSIPSTFTLYFFPSSDIIRERINLDLSRHGSVHLGNGDAQPLTPETELITLTHTEVNGTHIPPEIISQYARAYPKALIAVDASCALPYASLPYEDIDIVFLDFHFGFGLPAGLAVWMVNDKCFERHALIRQSQGYNDSAFSLGNLQKHSSSDGASRDINLLMIATLNGVLGDMLSRGIHTLRKETEYKAAILYHLLGNHPFISPAVSEKSARARTIIAADCGTNYKYVSTSLQRHAVVVGPGQGRFRDRHLLFANFPTHSREQFERVIDILNDIR